MTADQQSERLRRELALHAAEAGVWELDLTTRLVTASPEAQMVFGLGVSSGARHLDDYLQQLEQEDRECVVEELSRAAARGQSFCISARLRESGKLLICRGGVVRDPASGVALILHGVVLAGNQPASVDAAHRKFRLHIENTPLAVIEFENGDTISSWSPRAEEIFGWKAEEVTGKRIEDVGLVYEDDRASVASLLVEMTAGQKLQNIHVNRNRRRDGSILHCAWHNSVLADEDGRLDSVLSLVLDITERVRSREEITRLHLELSQRLEELQKIVEIAPVGLGICTDGTANQIQGNRYLADLLGVSQDWNLSQTRADGCDPGYRVFANGQELDGNTLPMQIAARTGETIREAEFQIVRADGTAIDLLASAAPLTDGAGHLRGSVGCFVDITERTRLQDELRTSNADLMQFIWAVNHDLQEPLRMMTAFAQLLERRYASWLDDGGREYLQFVLEGARRMNSMLCDLLEFTRAGSEDRGTQSCNADQAAQIALRNLSSLIAQKSAAITINPLPEVMIPEVHLVQLLQNLLANALKYSKSDIPPCIQVTAKRTGSAWEFCVRDNGIGIAPEQHEYIFGMFHRLHEGTADGTGLGLALCKRIVERHGGTIRVESEPGQGSAFLFKLCSGSHETSDANIAG